MDKESISLAEIEQRINGLFWQYRKIETPIDLQVKIDDALLTHQLKSNQAGHLYRIIQEATHNTIKHSRATHFQITFEKMQNQIQLTISDNGVGFDQSVQPAGDHYGMKNMKTRAEQMGADLAIESAQGSGVKMVMMVDL
jgi:signal transduction histidine kinase